MDCYMEDGDQSSRSESDVSDSDFQSSADKPYAELKEGKHKVRNADGTFRCPFCLGRKKQDYRFKDLRQHAIGAGKASSRMNPRQKANHLAVVKYLEKDLLHLSDVPTSQLPIVVTKPLPKPIKQDELFVSPWTGIIRNILEKPNEEKLASLKVELSTYKPLDVHMLWIAEEDIGYTIVDFGKGWAGYRNAMQFEATFEINHHGKKEWSESKQHRHLDMYGWVARADDYDSVGSIGGYLHNIGELTTIPDLVQVLNKEKQETVSTLKEEIDDKNEDLSIMQTKYAEKSINLRRVMEETARLQLQHNEALRNMELKATEHANRIIWESQQLRRNLENQKKELEDWSMKLSKHETQNEVERRKFINEKNKNVLKDTSLHMAAEEQKISDANIMRKTEEHKREKELALQKVVQLEKELDAKQKLELEIQELKNAQKRMKLMVKEDDSGLEQQMIEMDNELNEKEEELNYYHSMNTTLMVKDREATDELQEARKLLIDELDDVLNRGKVIVIKRMGELDQKPFLEACRKKYRSVKLANAKSAILFSEWQEQVKKPDWHPIKVVSDEAGKTSAKIDEEDEKLMALKNEFGDKPGGVYAAVTRAVMELYENNASGGYTVPVLWKPEEDKKATLKDVFSFILEQIKDKRKRI